MRHSIIMNPFIASMVDFTTALQLIMIKWIRGHLYTYLRSFQQNTQNNLDLTKNSFPQMLFLLKIFPNRHSRILLS